MTRWPAPLAPGPLRGVVHVPGSKSATARAFVLASLADAPSRLFGVLSSRDSGLMRAGLTGLGAGIFDGDGHVRVDPIGEVSCGATVDCGLAGTVLRFLPPVAALGHGVTSFTGDPRASERPVAPLLDALTQLGVEVSEPRRLPFRIDAAGRSRGGVVRVDASGSSQFVSGLLLVGARFEDGLTVVHTGTVLPSRPHIAMTVAMLRAHGVAVDEDGDAWTVHPGPIAGGDEWIEPDLTNTATFLAAALVTGGELRAPWPAHTVQAGGELLAVLEAFGASVIVGPGEEVTVRGPDGVRGASVELGAVSEITPVAAALAALADSPSTITGVAHIRGHETDRLAALATELDALGAGVRETPDGLVVTPRPLRPTRDFHTSGDHRMAHAAALIGLVTPGIVVDDIDVTTKTLADFPGLWADLVGCRGRFPGEPGGGKPVHGGGMGVVPLRSYHVRTGL